jgi:hypothetical protein
MNLNYKTPGAYEKISVDTAIGLTVAKIAVGRDTAVLIGVETDQIRFRCDGTAPTSAEGILVDAGQKFTLYGNEVLNNLLMIKVTSAASVKVQYFHEL